ncbi:GNAT family N-acetyltransferase [Lacticaseibacillus hulanensis]|uniref:GNAT family N-acetyltransferase n=1 Tax=Lacticaseibacillus hulanensis TaxID=2493111 RepID=UPI000FDC59C8|nr:GNAT family N-acetyltransferase [Lacticaseibacillus hulanensis]
MQIKTTTVLDSQIHAHSVAIRTAVFVKEQNVPTELEVDEDEGKCVYFVGYNNAGTPMATLRLNPESYGYHVQRVAVMKQARGTGLGREIMQKAIEYAKEHGAEKLVLGAQTHATGFYEGLGFTYTNKPEFMDAGIPHREMQLKL